MTTPVSRGIDADQVVGAFAEMLANIRRPWPGWWSLRYRHLVRARGLQEVERPPESHESHDDRLLVITAVVLAVNSMFMPGAKEGLTLFRTPDS